MESNISRDHIALEAMKMIFNANVRTQQTIWNKIKVLLFGGKPSVNIFPNPEITAMAAYDYADKMIAEREKSNGSRQKEA